MNHPMPQSAKSPARLSSRHARHNRVLSQRAGTSLVEFAFVFPVFMIFIFAMFEFGHALMIANMVTTIAKEAAHQGSFEGTSTADVLDSATTRLNAILPDGAGTVFIKDASTFELSDTDSSSVDAAALPNIELSDAESRQLFLVHVEVDYQDVALITPFWIRNVTLRGSSVMRRE
jgi:Flp pilus assembly protein TadG